MMRSYAVVVIAIAALLVLATGSAIDTTAAQQEIETVTQDEEPQYDVTITIQLRENGDARWNVTTEIPVDTDDETEVNAFQRLAADFERGQLDTSLSVSFFQQMAGQAESETGRSMGIADVNRSTQITNETGELTLSFTWANFANTTEDELILGDVFVADSGTWLPSLAEHQRLIIKPPQNYAVDSTPSRISVESGGVLHIQGPRTFAPGELTVRYVERDPPEPPDPGFDELTTAVFVLTSIFGGLGVYIWTRRRDGGFSPFGSTGSAPDESATTESAAAADDVEGDDGFDEQLLSDEERIKRLLVENDARMMQADIVAETNWSNAKVSQLLSSMADDSQIQKLRIGRENLIALPDEDITDVK